MARVTAVSLRDKARGAMMAAGGRGFMRFPESGALLVSDAVRRCGSDEAKAALVAAMAQAGFDCREQDGLLMLRPQAAVLESIAYEDGFSINWESTLWQTQALAVRWLKCDKQPLSPAGQQMVIDTLRLTWQDRMADDWMVLRAQAAVMQREGDTSGLYQAGAVLANWCDRQEGKRHED